MLSRNFGWATHLLGLCLLATVSCAGSGGKTTADGGATGATLGGNAGHVAEGGGHDGQGGSKALGGSSSSPGGALQGGTEQGGRASGGAATRGGRSGLGGTKAAGGASSSSGGRAGSGEACGTRVCPADQTCCNASCSLCAPRGNACIQIACDPSSGGTPGTACKSNADCRLFDDYCTGCDCRALGKSEPDPRCDGPGVRCLIAPCRDQQAACVEGRCVAQ